MNEHDLYANLPDLNYVLFNHHTNYGMEECLKVQSVCMSTNKNIFVDIIIKKFALKLKGKYLNI